MEALQDLRNPALEQHESNKLLLITIDRTRAQDVVEYHGNSWNPPREQLEEGLQRVTRSQTPCKPVKHIDKYKIGYNIDRFSLAQEYTVTLMHIACMHKHISI